MTLLPVPIPDLSIKEAKFFTTLVESAVAFLVANTLSRPFFSAMLSVAVVSVSATSVTSATVSSLALSLSRILSISVSTAAAFCRSAHSQNSRLALPSSNLRTRSGSFTPGSSIMIPPSVPSSRWMLGCATPNWSIRFVRILNELSMAELTSLRRTSFTCSSVLFALILSRSCWVANTVQS